MSVNNNTALAFPPLKVPLIDPKTGVMTSQWAMWFQQLTQRVGGLAPVNPAIKSINLANQYAFTTYTDSTGAITGTVGGLILFYRSGIGLTTVLDALNVKNTTSAAATLAAWNVPYGQIPSSQNIILGGYSSGLLQPVSIAGGANATIQQTNGIQLGSGAGIVLQASAPAALLCSLTGRILS